MEEDALIGNDFKLQVGNGESPEQFADFCAVFDAGELGEDKPLVDITTLCDNARRYRNGLADGLEIPLVANFKGDDGQIRGLYADFKNNATRNFQLVTKDSPEEVFAFSAIVRGWRIKPSVGEKASATFTLKISGEVIWDQSGA